MSFFLYYPKVVFLQKKILFRLGTRDFQWTQVLGVFLAIITVLMLVKSAAVMFDSWQAIKAFDKCANDYLDGTVLAKESSSVSGALLAEIKYQGCKESLYEITGAQIPSSQVDLTSRQAATAFVGPVASFFFWAILFMFSLFLLFNKTVVIPIEEIETVARPFRKR
jgi:hypothetical protein